MDSRGKVRTRGPRPAEDEQWKMTREYFDSRGSSALSVWWKDWAGRLIAPVMHVSCSEPQCAFAYIAQRRTYLKVRATDIDDEKVGRFEAVRIREGGFAGENHLKQLGAGHVDGRSDRSRKGCVPRGLLDGGS